MPEGEKLDFGSQAFRTHEDAGMSWLEQQSSNWECWKSWAWEKLHWLEHLVDWKV